MSLLKTVLALGALNLVSQVAAHGSVKNMECNGQSYGGIGWSHENTENSVGWVCPTLMYNEFVDPPRYGSKDIICNTGNTPGPKAAPVKAGSTVTMQWSDWPDHHRGPMLTYLADCKGPCKDVDPSKLEFFKIAEAGMSQDIPSDQPGTGHWATDDLRANGMQWDIVIPKGIADSNYVIRHEIIALQEVTRTGAQNYARCFNLEVTGGGSDRPAGVLGTALYKASDPGLTVDITQAQPNGYQIPGPPLYNGGSSNKPSSSQASMTNSQTSSTATSAPSTSGTPEADGGNDGSGSTSTESPAEADSQNTEGGEGYSNSPSNTPAESQNQEADGTKDQSESPSTSNEASADQKPKEEGNSQEETQTQEESQPQEEGNGDTKPESGEGEQSTSVYSRDAPEGGETGECPGQTTVVVTVTATATPTSTPYGGDAATNVTDNSTEPNQTLEAESFRRRRFWRV